VKSAIKILNSITPKMFKVKRDKKNKKRIFRNKFWIILFLFFLSLLTLNIFGVIEFRIFIALFTLIYSISVGVSSIFDPSFMTKTFSKKLWKLIVFSSFFMGILLIILGIIRGYEILLFLSIPFWTMFSIQIMIESLDNYGVPGLSFLAFLSDYYFFGLMVHLIGILFIVLSKLTKRKK
jgi:hypothetical protein